VELAASVTTGAVSVVVETSYTTVPADEVTTEVCVAVRMIDCDCDCAFTKIFP